MVFKQFRFNMILRVLLLTSTCLALVHYSEQQLHIYAYLGSRADRIPGMVTDPVCGQDQPGTGQISLKVIRYSEFTRSFQIKEAGSSFDELNAAFNDVMKDFQQVRSEREEHFHYLQSIVQNIDVSILAYQRDGTVEMINPAAKKLFQVNNLQKYQ